MSLATIVTWLCVDPLLRLMLRPTQGPRENIGDELTVRGLLEGFLVKCQIALVGRILLAPPLAFCAVWAFVAPGLTRRARATVRPLVPVSGMLFADGAMGYDSDRSLA